MVRQKGGEKWKQGADGCIFNPSVRCQGQAEIPGTISKIVPKITFDDINQAFISSRFKHVVEGKGVLIAKAVCTPEFLTKNSSESPEIASAAATTPCKKIDTKHPELYTNFVTEPYDMDFWHACNPPSLPPPAPPTPQLDLVSSLKILRRALNAAVALVPDAGPWVVGLDFHIGNILVKKKDNEQFSSLADWGRTLIIEDPTNIKSIQKGLRNAAETMIDTGLMDAPPDIIPAPYKRDNYISFLQSIGGPTKDWPQFGVAVRGAMDAIFHSTIGSIFWYENQLAHIRVNSVIGILRSSTEKNSTTIATLPNVDTLLSKLQEAKSQQEMITILNLYINDTKVPGLGTNTYIDLATFFPPVSVPSPVSVPDTPQVPPPVPIPAPAPKRSFFNRLLGLVRGGKQTRKQKKTLKKRGKTRQRR